MIFRQNMRFQAILFVPETAWQSGKIFDILIKKLRIWDLSLCKIL